MTDTLNQSCGVLVHTTPTIQNKCKRTAIGRLADGTPACRVHLKIEKQKEDKNLKFDDKFFKAEQYKRECTRLSKVLGIDIKPVYEYRSGGYVTTDIQLSITDLQNLCHHGCQEPEPPCENCTKFQPKNIDEQTTD